MGKPRHFVLNAFDMNCAGHINHGLWTHPRDRSADFASLDHWITVAKAAERGLFDAIFIADIAGIYEVYEGRPDAAMVNGVQVPVNDPMLIVPTMAHATRHIGFGVTVNTTIEQPYTLARRFSTLDHLTNGRVGWNVVTGYVDSAARGVGRAQNVAHDVRYEMADEFMEVAYRLWEESWDEDALRADKTARVFVDPAKVRPVRFAGEHYAIDAVHMCAPSPQRTPVIFQAGASDRGRQFAARHAECVFIHAPTAAIGASMVRDFREALVEAGRDPYAARVIASLSAVVGRTAGEAADKLAEYRAHASVEGGLAHFSASSGIDLAKFAMDDVIPALSTNAQKSAVEALTKRSPEPWTKRRLVDQMVLGSRIAPVVGTPGEIADHMRRYAAATDVDGFNLVRTVTPECIEDFVDLVVPELQERGVHKTAYAAGPLREKLFGHPRLRPPHVGARAKTLEIA